jgi:3D (Asp-Asp-Asp) domain-containing protein
VNPTDNAQKATNLGAIIAAAYLIAAVAIAGQWEREHIQDRISAAIEVKQLALADKQRELQQAQNQVAAQQTEIHELSSRSGGIQSVDAGPWLAFSATFYDGKHDGWETGTVTRSGAPVKSQWTVAADPHLIPLGSLVEVRFPNGEDRIFQATDTGGAIKGRKIDVYEPDLAKCFENGRQAVMVRILVKGSV